MKKIYILLLLLLLQACSPETPDGGILIENARHEPIYLQIEQPKENANGKLAVIQHGLASDMEHPAVQTAKKAFLDNGYTVILFDSRYSLGKSGQDVAKVRLSTFAEDLQTVINWAKMQKFYAEPLALAGHSLGGASVLQYAAAHPEQVGILVPITPVVSGQKWENSCMANMTDFCTDWKNNRFYNYETVVIPYQVVEDAKTYDALQLADSITADTLLITAAHDTVITPEDVKELYNVMPGQKRLAVVPNSGHNFETLQNQKDLYNFIADFLSLKRPVPD